VLPLNHYHHDRFDTTDDEVLGKFSVNVLANPHGEIDRAVMSLDEAEATFTRRPDAVMRDPSALAPLVGTYESPTGVTFQTVLRERGRMARVSATGAETPLEPVRPWVSGVKAFSDVRCEFVVEGGAGQVGWSSRTSSRRRVEWARRPMRRCPARAGLRPSGLTPQSARANAED
jgi:hypothetical protein